MVWSRDRCIDCLSSWGVKAVPATALAALFAFAELTPCPVYLSAAVASSCVPARGRRRQLH